MEDFLQGQFVQRKTVFRDSCIASILPTARQLSLTRVRSRCVKHIIPVSHYYATKSLPGLQRAWVELRREDAVGSTANSELNSQILTPSIQRYFTDSLVNRIYAYDYDNGNISNRRLFVDSLALGLPEGTFPDGLCIDSDGGIWSARYDAN